MFNGRMPHEWGHRGIRVRLELTRTGFNFDQFVGRTCMMEKKQTQLQVRAGCEVN